VNRLAPFATSRLPDSVFVEQNSPDIKVSCLASCLQWFRSGISETDRSTMQTDRIFGIRETTYPQEPHFVEEGTILSARPVVPLEDIRARVRHRRSLALTGALALAVLFGACAALLIAHLEQRPLEPSVTASSQPAELPVDGNSSGQIETTPSVTENDTESPSDSPLVANSQREQARGGVASTTAASSRRPLPRAADSRLSRNVSKANAVVNEPDDETVQPSADQRSRRLERWEEKRLRRETLRDRRAVDRDSGDDLFRIREIFEGPRRPH
jgi:hypothetical protein